MENGDAQRSVGIEPVRGNRRQDALTGTCAVLAVDLEKQGNRRAVPHRGRSPGNPAEHLTEGGPDGSRPAGPDAGNIPETAVVNRRLEPFEAVDVQGVVNFFGEAGPHSGDGGEEFFRGDLSPEAFQETPPPRRDEFHDDSGDALADMGEGDETFGAVGVEKGPHIELLGRDLPGSFSVGADAEGIGSLPFEQVGGLAKPFGDHLVRTVSRSHCPVRPGSVSSEKWYCLVPFLYSIVSSMEGKGREPGEGPQVPTAVLLALALLIGGCASARQVVLFPDGGVVAVSSPSEQNRRKALEIIGGHCRGGYDITMEEEVPVGTRVREETTADLDRKDRVTSTTEYSVRTRYEWRIHYRCR